MLKVANFFDRPDIDSIDAVLIRNVKYLRSFTINEFKTLYNIDTIRVILTEKKFVVFTFLDCIGYLAEIGVPSNPEISLVTDAKGNLFYLLHETGYRKDELMFFKTTYNSKPGQPIQKSKVFTKRSSRCYSDWEDEQEYLRSSYEDAFEGDSDAYWNID
ncbi:MAG: hypothetical protein HDR95_05095 [Bacteroides sp.]|nr:hypothetical protein [Bacteroides sp.]